MGVTKRARILFYNPENTDSTEIKEISYEDLSNQKWRNSIAIRQANNVYNQSLIASLIEHNGVDKTKKWLEGFVKTLPDHLKVMIELKFLPLHLEKQN